MSVDYNPPSSTYSTIKIQDSTHALLASYQTTKVKAHSILTLTKTQISASINRKKKQKDS